MSKLQVLTKKNTYYPNTYKLETGVEDKFLYKIAKLTAPSSFDITSKLANVNFTSNGVYTLKVIYRSRGNGSSSRNKCSAIGYSSTWNINNTSVNLSGNKPSSEVYDLCNGHILLSSYKITIPSGSNIKLSSFKLESVIKEAPTSGDGQTLDVYYYELLSPSNVILASAGIHNHIYEFTKDNNIYLSLSLEGKTNMPITLGKSYLTDYDLSYVESTNKLTGSIKDLETKVIKSGEIYQKTIVEPCVLSIYLRDFYINKSVNVEYLYSQPSYTGTIDGNNFTMSPVYKNWSYSLGRDGQIYLYVNGKLINSDNFDLDNGGWFDLGYCKPGTVITVRYCYRSPGNYYNWYSGTASSEAGAKSAGAYKARTAGTNEFVNNNLGTGVTQYGFLGIFSETILDSLKTDTNSVSFRAASKKAIEDTATTKKAECATLIENEEATEKTKYASSKSADFENQKSTILNRSNKYKSKCLLHTMASSTRSKCSYFSSPTWEKMILNNACGSSKYLDSCPTTNGSTTCACRTAANSCSKRTTYKGCGNVCIFPTLYVTISAKSETKTGTNKLDYYPYEETYTYTTYTINKVETKATSALSSNISLKITYKVLFSPISSSVTILSAGSVSSTSNNVISSPVNSFDITIYNGSTALTTTSISANNSKSFSFNL